ncbi:septal ring lytic transglycosylase RlpA family protein [Synechococcus sp. CBW1108]|uniref:septal ring lytic transglycosylase RlpA family protein n=1 Tax=Synechococcus sp. CBW1108 TaxID=1353147 RepID=UPI0018CDEB59|nr:septal ring lytic transglycosylase RlpA family protein [Synechococcus sp. CBW1108]QPN69060.1 septal ring lytic transglycosylase RlpA family protein [Synechococcus sp. CBW1108]
MRRTFSLGALALLLPGSALVPAIADSSFAATQNEPAVVAAPSSAALEPTPEVAIREVGTDVLPDQGTTQQAPPTRLAPAPKPAPRVLHSSSGQASWYGPGFYGNRTANGEVFRPGTMTAAHRTLPFGTKVKVTNLWNGRTTVVRINDRGPFHGNRVIDLAHGAAHSLGVTASGIAQVRLDVLQ